MYAIFFYLLFVDHLFLNRLRICLSLKISVFVYLFSCFLLYIYLVLFGVKFNGNFITLSNQKIECYQYCHLLLTISDSWFISLLIYLFIYACMFAWRLAYSFYNMHHHILVRFCVQSIAEATQTSNTDGEPLNIGIFLCLIYWCCAHLCPTNALLMYTLHENEIVSNVL
jgi:hypothetical protein